jgi:hypothetical protein
VAQRLLDRDFPGKLDLHMAIFLVGVDGRVGRVLELLGDEKAASGALRILDKVNRLN